MWNLLVLARQFHTVVLCSLLWFTFINCDIFRPSHHRRLSMTLSGCSDANNVLARAAQFGYDETFVCPYDGIAKIVCDETPITKNTTELIRDIQSLDNHISWKQIVFYLMVGPNSKYDALRWWIPLISEPLNLVVIGDSCGSNSEDECEDNAFRIKQSIQTITKLVNVTIVRVHPNDAGYGRLSCKLRTGTKKLYRIFPDSKLYFKIDTDTLVFPKRFIRFARSIALVTQWDSLPYYFGTVIESGSNLLLCGRDWTEFGNTTKGGMCYAQGGAGYGLNNIAMKALTESKSCDTPGHNTYRGKEFKHDLFFFEDVFVGIRMYEEFQLTPIHCGSFSSSEIAKDHKMLKSITFHFIDSNWLKQFGERLFHHLRVSGDVVSD